MDQLQENKFNMHKHTTLATAIFSRIGRHTKIYTNKSVRSCTFIVFMVNYKERFPSQVQHMCLYSYTGKYVQSFQSANRGKKNNMTLFLARG
jgi:hypothetical protein